MASTPRSIFPPPVDDPERQAAPFDDPLDDTIDQSFPASDPPSTNPAPSYTAESRAAAQPASSSRWPIHLRHEGLVWAASGALGAAAAFRLMGDRRASRLVWLAPAAILAGVAITLAQQYRDSASRSA